MRHLGLAIAAFAAIAAVPAAAITLTFDDIGNFAQVGSYNGFDFNNFYALDTTQYGASGYDNDLVSPNNIIYNGYAAAASISAATPFNLTSGYFAGAWQDGLTITVTGTLAGAPVFTQQFVVDTQSPQFELLNSASIDSVTLIGSGGTPHGYSGAGEHFALDNLTINGGSATPEPASWALMIAGFGLVGGALRRRVAGMSLA